MLCASLSTAFGTPSPQRHDFHLQFIAWVKEAVADYEKTLKEQVAAAKEMQRCAGGEEIIRQNKYEAAEEAFITKSNAVAGISESVMKAKEAVDDAKRNRRTWKHVKKKMARTLSPQQSERMRWIQYVQL